MGTLWGQVQKSPKIGPRKVQKLSLTHLGKSVLLVGRWNISHCWKLIHLALWEDDTLSSLKTENPRILGFPKFWDSQNSGIPRILGSQNSGISWPPDVISAHVLPNVPLVISAGYNSSFLVEGGIWDYVLP